MEYTLTDGERLLELVMSRKYARDTISNLVYTSILTKKKQEYFREALDLLEDGTATEIDLHRWTQRKMKAFRREIDQNAASAKERISIDQGGCHR